jgi:TolB-like protein/AraC-like DNA-binding protein/Tfp pilus assembly protein PilF
LWIHLIINISVSEHPVKDQIFISKLTEIILANLGNENFGVNELVQQSGLSHYSLTRRLQAISNKTIKQFIREVRLQRALEMLQKEEVTISEVAYKVGFGSPAYFNTCFHEFFGYPPGAVKKGDFVKTKEPGSSDFGQRQKRNPLRSFLLVSSGILVLAVSAYLIYNLFFFKSSPRSDISPKYQKSIAVLPFKNLSDSAANQYFIDGLMEEILSSLSKIHDLKVISRTSVEPFRGTDKSSTEIGNKLHADYIVEGSGQKYGNTFRLRVQLIDASKDKHIWTESYEREINVVKDIFGTQSQIAQSIASELKAIITPEEKRIIEKVPTTSITAYDFYRRGREEYGKYEVYKGNLEAVRKAEALYRRALEYDSAFARAYTGLAAIYWDKNYSKEYFSQNFMDSILILCDIALSFDNQLAEAYTLKGTYYSETGKPEKAVEAFDMAIQLNPNDWKAYSGKAEFYNETDWINYIKYIQEAVAINHGPELPALLLNIWYAYNSAGIPEKARQYIQDKLKLDGDSADYYAELSRYERWIGNFNKSIEYGVKGYRSDSTNATLLVILGNNFASIGQYGKSLEYYNRWIGRSKILGDAWIKHNMHRVAYAYSQNGNKKAAEHFLNEQMNYCTRSIELGRKYAQMLYAYYDLAGIYAFEGKKEKAYENLKIFNKRSVMSSWMVSLIKTDPLFETIRNEPEFQQIVRDVEAKYQAEHERVKKWLEEQAISK